MSRPAVLPPRRRGLALALLSLLVSALAVVTANPSAAATRPVYGVSADMHVRRAAVAAQPWVGLISPSADQARALVGSSVDHIVIGLGWDSVEPSPGVYDSSALNELRAWVSTANSIGLKVVLDLGLHYPPSWVFGLPGQTRFVNQYGDAWHGPLSEDIPNAVFNTSVRAAEADYVAHLASALNGTTVSSVRIGGLLSGELRYPNATYNGNALSLWMYDPAAQAGAPYPGWVPGAGTAAQASASLAYYFGSLTNYETWMMQTVNAAFPGVDQQVMFPSWGLRPGMVDDAIAAGLHNTTVAEVNGMVSAGLDWQSQVAAMSGHNATVYSTWVDAPSQGSTVQQIPPIAYLSQLAATYNLPLAGENTGGGGQPALDLLLQRATQFHLSGVMYMSGPLIDNGTAGITLNNLMASAAAR